MASRPEGPATPLLLRAHTKALIVSKMMWLMFGGSPWTRASDGAAWAVGCLSFNFFDCAPTVLPGCLSSLSSFKLTLELAAYSQIASRKLTWNSFVRWHHVQPLSAISDVCVCVWYSCILQQGRVTIRDKNLFQWQKKHTSCLLGGWTFPAYLKPVCYGNFSTLVVVGINHQIWTIITQRRKVRTFLLLIIMLFFYYYAFV